MITWLHLFENPLLIRFQIDRKLTFDPARTNGAGSKVNFRSVWKRIKSEFSNKSRHVTIKFGEKLGWIKSETACICFTWPTSFTVKTGSKVVPPRRILSGIFSDFFEIWVFRGLGRSKIHFQMFECQIFEYSLLLENSNFNVFPNGQTFKCSNFWT